jgi:hypothetical protein
MEEKQTEQVKEERAKHFVELHHAPLIRRFCLQQNAAASEALWNVPAGSI